MTIEKNSRDHVVLYAMVRWFGRHREDNPSLLAEIVVTSKLAEQEYPVGFYGKDTAYHIMSKLHDHDYVKQAKFHGKTIGWVLSEKGLDKLEELGTPAQYDH